MPILYRLYQRIKWQYKIDFIILGLSISLILIGCQHQAKYEYIVTPTQKYIPPKFDLVQLNATTDTLDILLDDSTYNAIESFNLFSNNAEEFISFFDERSLSVNIYHFKSGKKAKRIPLIDALMGDKLFKSSAYTLNFDSILFNNNNTIYLLDSFGKVKTKLSALENPPLAWAVFDNNTPPVLKNGRLYASVRPYMNDESLKALKKWKVLYEFDLSNKEAILHYHFPVFLQKNYYGTRFLKHSYCYNDRGHFVFSFPADSAIYETNLNDYHVAYSGKSRFQQAMIPPMSKKEVDEEGRKNYMLRDSYGSIYFDPVNKRYLRVAQSKINEREYEANDEKEERIILFDENFRIIGESPVDNSISLSSLFISKQGEIYARVLRKDEYALHFVRLAYSEDAAEPIRLTKK